MVVRRGQWFLAAGEEPLACPDCRGELWWAEDIYSAWYRQCSRCGALWLLRPTELQVVALPVIPQAPCEEIASGPCPDCGGDRREWCATCDGTGKVRGYHRRTCRGNSAQECGRYRGLGRDCDCLCHVPPSLRPVSGRRIALLHRGQEVALEHDTTLPLEEDPRFHRPLVTWGEVLQQVRERLETAGEEPLPLWWGFRLLGGRDEQGG